MFALIYMGNKVRRASLMAAVALGLVPGCYDYDRVHYLDFRHPSEKYGSAPSYVSEEPSVISPSLHVEDSLVPSPAVEGIVSFERVRDFPVFFHDVAVVHFDNGETFYVGRTGANSYLIDTSGKLLTRGSHKIIKRDNSFFVQTGADKELNSIPHSYQDLSPSRLSWLEQEFEERGDGLYVCGWDEFTAKK